MNWQEKQLMVAAPQEEVVVKFTSMHTKLLRTLAEFNQPISTGRLHQVCPTNRSRIALLFHPI